MLWQGGGVKAVVGRAVGAAVGVGEAGGREVRRLRRRVGKGGHPVAEASRGTFDPRRFGRRGGAGGGSAAAGPGPGWGGYGGGLAATVEIRRAVRAVGRPRWGAGGAEPFHAWAAASRGWGKGRRFWGGGQHKCLPVGDEAYDPGRKDGPEDACEPGGSTDCRANVAKAEHATERRWVPMGMVYQTVMGWRWGQRRRCE